MTRCRATVTAIFTCQLRKGGKSHLTAGRLALQAAGPARLVECHEVNAPEGYATGKCSYPLPGITFQESNLVGPDVPLRGPWDPVRVHRKWDGLTFIISLFLNPTFFWGGGG